MQKEFLLKTKRDDEIKISAFGVDHIKTANCIICVHGFKGFKDWGFWPFTAKYLSEKGYLVLTFNFSHNGIGNNLLELTELEKFAENTFSLEVEELEQIIQSYRSGFFGDVLNSKIGLIGHSRGAAVSMLSTIKSNIDAIVLWSPLFRIDRYSERQKQIWEENGFLEFENARTKQMMRLNFSFLNDIQKNKNSHLDLDTAIKKFNNPLLILHGEQDLTIHPDEAAEIFKCSGSEEKFLEIIPKTGHTFNVQHPFTTSEKVFDFVINKTEEFFGKYLN